MRNPFVQRAGRANCLTVLLATITAVIAPLGLAFAADVGPKIEIPAEGASLPMLDIGGRPVVEVKINGKGPFPFILDTGAMFSVIDTGLSDELSLGDSDQIKELIIGAIKVTDLEIKDISITAMFGKVDKPPRGVLSALAFPGYLLTFDYPRKTITLRKGALPEADAKKIFAYGADEMLPIVPMKVAGHDVKVHLDTGAPFALALPTKYKDQLPMTAPAVEKGKARTHAGDFPVFQGTVDGEIEIGEFKLASHDIHFTDVVPHLGAAPQGQVGYAALRDFVVTLDSANRRIQFARP